MVGKPDSLGFTGETATFQPSTMFGTPPQNIRDVDIKGGYVEIRKGSVKVLSIVGFSAPEGSVYRISHEDEAGVGFVHSTNELYSGHLNRLSGRLNLAKSTAREPNKVDLLYAGNCSPAKPLF